MSATPPTPPGRPPGPPPPTPPPGRPAAPTPDLPPPAVAVPPPPPAPEPAPPEPTPPEPEVQEPPPPAAPPERRRPSRRVWLIGAAVAAVVVIVVVVIALVAGGGDDGESADSTFPEPLPVTTSGGADEPHPCELFDGIVEASDVESAFGVTISSVEPLAPETCTFKASAGDTVVGVSPGSDFAEIRNGELFSTTAEDLSGVGDEAFYGGDASVAGTVLFARQGDVLVSVAFFAEPDSSRRDHLIALMRRILGRIPAGLTLPTTTTP